MAGSVVSFVLGKLADAFVKEVLHVCGVSDQVEKVSRELTRIQAFLKDADMKRIVDERQKQWVKEVRDLAYWIEDVIDTFLSEATEKKPGKREAVKRFFTKTKNLPAIHRLGDEINKIEARIQEIEISRVRYGITNIGEGVEGEIQQPIKRIVVPDIDEAGIVGFEADREKLVSLLLDETNTRRSVISIVGTGGLGKTTLARKVYSSEAVKQQFDILIWVTVSQKFELIDIFRKIAEQLQIQPPKDLSEYQLTSLYQSLANKRYLLILDDIWTKILWNQIEGLLPAENNRSRILITTRFSNVAEEADSICVPYKLQFLNEESSLELLLQKALPNRNANERYPNDLYNIGKQFAKKCGGLPLALVVLGGLLSRKPSNYIAWSRVLETMDWGTDGEECVAIISTSYEDLPLALKSCFMYFAAFPEDYEINSISLLNMWIAEGFIPQEENKTLEDTAESFLEDLLQRNMIQESERNFDGFITFCRIHDVLHGLAIQKAKDDNFLIACSKLDDLHNCSQLGRRLAIHDSSWSINGEDAGELPRESMAFAAPNLRSIFSHKPMPKLSQLVHLKLVRNTGRTRINCVYEPNERLSNLRYVELGLEVNNSEDIYTFQKFIGAMRFLQTLDLRRGSISCDLPDYLWHIKPLRHVLLPLPHSTYGPPSSADLMNLQTLSGVTSRESWVATGLPKLPNVKILKIVSCSRFLWNTIAILLGTLKHLIYLKIVGDDVPLNIIDMRGFPFYHRLQNLEIRDEQRLCDKEVTLDIGMFPVHLTTLSLQYVQFQQNPMPVLEKLGYLRSLFLRGYIRQLCCSPGGFDQLEQLELCGSVELEECKIEEGALPRLKRLVLSGCPRLVGWKIGKGAMPVLKEIEVTACPLLHVPDGLAHLTVLEKLTWNSCIPGLQKLIRSMCKHVPSINLTPVTSINLTPVEWVE